jgi:hypothetical protein
MEMYEMKKRYLLKKISDSSIKLVKFPRHSEVRYILKLAEENFIYSAPEVVDYAFHVLGNEINLSDFKYDDKKSNGLGLNIYGEPIKCMICDSPDHVQKDCEKPIPHENEVKEE